MVMPLEGTYEPSTWPWVAEQIELYERTEGREGQEMQGAPCVILWTRGRRSGAVRKSALIRINDGDQYAVVASKGGAPQHPSWYLNLVADPQVTLQDGPGVKDYRARTATPAEKAAWWPMAVAVWPEYDAYEADTERAIPLVILEPA